MKVITVNNMKGGVGKTTFVFNIATYLAHREKAHVLVIDLDAQSNTTKRFLPEDINPEVIKAVNASKLFTKEIFSDEPSKLIFESRFEGVDILPSHLYLSMIEMQSYAIINSGLRVRMFIDRIKDLYDYVIIDNSPSMNIYATNSLMAANYVLIPITPDIMSFEGITLIKDAIFEAKGFNTELEILGFVVNMTDKRYKTHKMFIESFKKLFKGDVFETTLTKRADYQKSIDMSKPIYELFKTSSPVHLEMKRFIEEFLERINKIEKAREIKKEVV